MAHPSELLDWLAVEFVERRMERERTHQADRPFEDVSTILDRDSRTPRAGSTESVVGPRPSLSYVGRNDSRHSSQNQRSAVPRLGGPSVHPYMPSDLWREVSHYGSTPATAQTYVQDHGEKLYRRSLYTFWKRTAPPPNMVAFDAPIAKYARWNVAKRSPPLQALVTLNDVQFVEAARAFATRILRHPTNNDEARMRWAFVEATAREPSEAERLILHRRLEKERVRYRDRKDVAW